MSALKGFFSSAAALFSRVKQRLGGEGAAACCTITSLDEVANAANPNNISESGADKAHISANDNMPHGENKAAHGAHDDAHIIHNPLDSKVDTILAPVVGYLSVGGLFIGWSIFKDFGNKAKALCKEQKRAENAANNVRAERAQLLHNETKNLSPKQAAEYESALHSYTAYDDYLKEQRREARFQQYAAGAASAAASAGIAAGQIVMPAGTAAMGGLALIGAAHTANGIKQYKDTRDKIRRAQEDGTASDKHVRLRHFKNKRAHLRRNIAGWGLFTAGAGVLCASQIAADIGKFFFPPAAVYAGVAGLGAGVAATVIENNIVTGYRFYNTLPQYIKQAMKDGTPESEHAIQERNRKADLRRELSKDYRKDFFEHRGMCASLTHGLMRAGQKILAYGTLGLIGAFSHGLKFATKTRISKQAASYVTDGKRNLALKKLAGITEAGNIETADTSGDYAKDAKPLGQLLDIIDAGGHAGHIMKILTKRAAYYKDTDKHGMKRYETRKQFAEIFDAESEDEIGFSYNDNFTALAGYGPCCDANTEGKRVTDMLRKRFTREGADPTLRDKAFTLLKEVTDQYLLFQLRRDSKEQICVWSDLSDGMAKRRENRGQERVLPPALSPGYLSKRQAAPPLFVHRAAGVNRGFVSETYVTA